MSFNVSGIYVEKGAAVTPQKVAAAVTAYWVGKGAKTSDADPRTIPPLSVEKTRKLGYAVLRAGSYIAIADSERYTADYSLAQHLAKALGVPVFWYGLYGATDGGAAAWFGAGKKGASKKPLRGYDEVEAYVQDEFSPSCVHLDELGAGKKGDRFFSFTNVKGYDEGPDPEDSDEDEDEEEQAPPKPAKKKSASPVAAPFPPFRLGKKKKSARDNLTIVFHVKALGGEAGHANSFASSARGVGRSPTKKAFGGEAGHANSFASSARGVGRSPTKKALGGAETVFAAYREAIPKDVLRWSLVGSSSTDVRPIKDLELTIRKCNAQLEKKAGFFFVMSDDDPAKPSNEEPDLPAYCFVASGCEDRDDAARIEMRFPSEYLWQVGAEKVVELATLTAKTLDYFSGYAGLSLCTFPLLSGNRDGFAVYEAAVKHPGFDVLTSEEALRNKVRGGARWLNFISAPLARKLGKIDAKLVTDIGEGTLLRASVEPSPDPDAKTLKALRSIAKALEPISYFNDPLLDLDTEEEKDRLDWERRFLK